MSRVPHQIAVMGAIGCATVTLDHIDDSLPLSRKSIQSALGRLIARGYVERLEIGVYRLTLTGRDALEDGSAANFAYFRPRKVRVVRDNLRQRAWKAMRLSGRRFFAVGDIVRLAARDEEKSAYGNIGGYITVLAKAGYLEEAHSGPASLPNNQKLWRVEKDSGDLAPILRRGRNLFDPNTGEVIPCR